MTSAPGGPSRRAIGIALDRETEAPVVIVKGAAETAEWLVAQSAAAATPVVRDPSLADALYRTPVDGPVGRELWPVMAILLAHVLRLDGSPPEIAP